MDDRPFGMREPILQAVILFGLVSHLMEAAATSWWLLGTSAAQISTEEAPVTAYKSLCKTLKYLDERQKELCTADRNVLRTVAQGTAMGIEECQYQFANKRWNCPTYNDSSSVFGSLLHTNTREKAYVHAISSAGIGYAITKACSQGDIADCGCDQHIAQLPTSLPIYRTNGRFQWGGCSDDVTFGERFSVEFVDTREKKHTVDGIINLHNNEAGRRHLKSNMQIYCKCHGVSGSCNVKICWRKLSTFRKIGDSLNRKFDGASQVRINFKKGKLRPKHRGQKLPAKDDLVYLEKSPDYCERNIKTGVPGTRGRRCNKTSEGVDGCGLLCCGRGYRTMLKEETSECRCKFVWCCKVQCEKCTDESFGS